MIDSREARILRILYGKVNGKIKVESQPSIVIDASHELDMEAVGRLFNKELLTVHNLGNCKQFRITRR